MRAHWSAILLVILLILILAYNRQIGAALQPLRLGEMWVEFCTTIWAMPSFGRFTLVTMVLALLYVTVYFLILNWRRR